jgi:hypothetical protein
MQGAFMGWSKFLAAAVVWLGLAACGGGGGGEGSGGANPPSPVEPVNPTTLRVKVADVLGFAKPGAVITVTLATPASGSSTPAPVATATTGADGMAVLELPPDADLLLRTSLAGHTEQLKPVRLARGADGFFEARLMARAPALTLPDAAAGGSLVGRNAARLTLPRAALVDAATGVAVTGAVQVEMTPVNTGSHELRAFPGSMRGVSASATGTTEGPLVSYGPVEYVFTQGGRKLALAPGQSAVIEMPLHSTLDVDGSALVLGETMPIWSLDERTGVWRQEGVGTVVASRSASGLALRATVSHFSWWNPDHFSNPRRLDIRFVFPAGVTPTECCHVEGLTVTGFPGPTSMASETMPPEGGSVIVDSPTLINLVARGMAGSVFLSGVIEQSVPLGSTPLLVTITLTADPNPPFPVITSPAAGVTTYTRGVLNVLASVSGGEPEQVQLLADGAVVAPMAGSPAAGYTANWDTTSFSERSYAITVRAIRGLTQVVSTPRTVVVDRKPPVVTARTPAPGASETAGDTAIVVTFNEALDPASLINDSAPTVRVVAGTTATGTALPLVLALSDDALTVTATPVTPLPTGSSYTVVVSGLTDRAGNVMAPVTWSFSVPLWALASPDLRPAVSTGPDAGVVQGFVLGRPELAVASNGEPLVLWRQADGPTSPFVLHAARRIGGVWVQLPPLLPALPPNSVNGEQSMALDSSGQPVVAYTQTINNIAGCSTTQPSQLFVARFNGSSWQQLDSSGLNIGPCTGPILPRLKIDAAGRPVVVSAQAVAFPLPRTMQVRRYDGSAWELLGTVPLRSTPAPSNITELRLAMLGDVPLVLSAENSSGTIRYYAARLEGGVFVPAGGLVAAGNASVQAALVIDPLGRPVAAVRADANRLLMLRLEGSASWAPVGGVLAAGAFVDDPSIVFDGLRPVVAWHDASVSPSPSLLRRFDTELNDWGSLLTVRSNSGTLSELRRLPAGGPIWAALTTGPFDRELRVVTTSALP